MKQSEIWLISLDPTIGAEINKLRPTIIINDNSIGRLPLKIIVPITDWKDRYGIAPWMIKILPSRLNGLTKESAADCFQIRSLSEERFVRKIGDIEDLLLEKFRKSVALILNIE